MPLINPALPADGDDLTQQSNNTPLQAILALLNGNIDSTNIKPGSLTGAQFASSSIPLSVLDPSVTGALIPVGVVLEWNSDGSSVPTGYQLADGSLITDARSPRVGKHVSARVNAIARGVSNQNLRDNPVTGGEDAHTLTQNEMPNHGHTVNDPGHGHGVNDPGHSHSTNGVYMADAGGAGNQGTNSPGNRYIQGQSNVHVNGSGTGISIQGSGTGIYLSSSGGNAAHNNLPYWVGVVPIEKIF